MDEVAADSQDDMHMMFDKDEMPFSKRISLAFFKLFYYVPVLTSMGIILFMLVTYVFVSI